MYNTVIHILDKRIELATKYKKVSETVAGKVFLSNEITFAVETILSYSPDIILISDSFTEDLKELTQKIKVLTPNYRPTIVFLSKSDDVQDKLKALNSGADDYLSEPIDMEEFKARLKAHLRRITESNLSPVTNLYDNKLSLIVLKRVLSSSKDFSSMLVDIDNFKPYKEVYGQIASEKMVQTYAAIINSCLSDDDFLGQLSENEFLVLTHPDKAEKAASFLVFAFDTVAEKFYSKKDAQNKYIIAKNDNKTEEKIGLVNTKIAIVSNTNKKHSNIQSVLNALIATFKLTQTKKGSNFAVERVKLPVNESVREYEFNNRISILEPDEALCFLLMTTAQIQGYQAEILTPKDEILEKLIINKPAVLIIDAGDSKNKAGLKICQEIKKNKNLSRIKLVVTSNSHNKEEILTSGADIYLPKPYDLLTIYSWVSKLVKDYNF